MSRQSRRYKKNNRAGKLAISFVMLTLLVVMSVKNQEYEAKEQSLGAQLEAETERQQELEEYEKYTQSQDYIEDVAKSKLGLVYKNEIVFKEQKK